MDDNTLEGVDSDVLTFEVTALNGTTWTFSVKSLDELKVKIAIELDTICLLITLMYQDDEIMCDNHFFDDRETFHSYQIIILHCINNNDIEEYDTMDIGNGLLNHLLYNDYTILEWCEYTLSQDQLKECIIEVWVLAADVGHTHIIHFFLKKNELFHDDDRVMIETSQKVLDRIFGEKGIDVNCMDQYEHTALVCSAMNGHSTIVNILIQAAANVNLRDFHNFPLHIASRNGCSEVVDLLIKGTANINVRDTDGTIPVQEAARNGFVDTLELLIDAGADLTCVDNDGEVALGMAVQRGHYEVVTTLIRAGVNINDGGTEYTPLMWSILRNHLKIMNFLIQSHADVNFVINHSTTALDLCNSNQEMIDHLIEAGAQKYEDIP